MKESVLLHALQNAWANPLVDQPVRLKPARLTGINGELISFDYFNTRYPLPNRTERFHIYHIGVYSSNAVLITKLSQYVWTSMDELVTEQDFIFHGYTDDGMFIPNHDVYVILSSDNDLIFAVRERRQYDLYRKTFFTRFQQNAYFASKFSSAPLDSASQGKQITTDSELIALRQSILKHQTYEGHTFIYKDGYLIDSETIQDAKIGSNLSFVYDSSIKEVIDFKLDELDTYLSAIDTNTKYVLHPNTATNPGTTVDYVDDVDFYLVHKDPNGGETKGVLIYRHSTSDSRSLTHRDWGLNYDQVQFLIDITKDIADYYIRAYVRHSGQDKRLNLSEDRIHELYKLPDAMIYESLTGKSALMSEWTATGLELSDYMQLVSSPYKQLDVNDVIRGYGYTSIAKAMGKATIEVLESNIPLGHALNENVTVFEYSIIGNLIGFHYHPAGSSYIPNSKECSFITVMFGKPGSEYNYIDNHSDKTVSSNLDIRVFDCPIRGGEPTLEWEEITDDVTKYRIENGEVIWNIDVDGRYGIVVDNSVLKIHQTTMTIQDGIIEIDIPSVLGLVPEKVDVFVNSKHLAADIDYKRIDNEIVILNTRYYDSKESLTFTVICKGIETTMSKYEIQEKTGFVVNGKMAVDKEYDLKDDKVLFCYMDGRLVMQEQVAWEEDGTGITRPGFNGFPFSITEAYVALPKLVDYDHYPRRQYSKERDQSITALFSGLGLYDKQTSPSIMTDYVLYSPFMSYIVNDVVKGLREPLEAHDSIDKYNDWCERYYKYLDYDPCVQFTNQQMQYVKILPSIHISERVSEKAYSFFNRVIEIYLNDRIILRDSVVIQ